jgi:Mg-chelatase subunit ChlD
MVFTRIRKHNTTYRPDRIALVGYHDRGFVIARPAEPHTAKLQERTRALHAKVAGSGTNITDGIRVSVGLLKGVPRGIYRRMWLLTDGHPNIEASGVMTAVQEAYAAHVNINCIAFGSDADEKLLQRIASATHNGKFVSVETLRELSGCPRMISK